MSIQETAIRLAGIVVLVSSVQPLRAQQPRQAVVTRITDSTKQSNGTLPGNKTLFGVSLLLTSGQSGDSGYSNPLGIDFEFVIRPTKRHRSTPYYIGFNFNISGTKSATPFLVPGTANGSLESQFNTSFIGLSNYYFLPSESSIKPFLGLTLGVRTMRNFVSTDYVYINPQLPWPGHDEVVNKSSSQFSTGMFFGCFFQIVGMRGLYFKTGVATGGDFDVCKDGSVKSTVRHQYTYEMGTTNSIFLTANLGLMF